jgi:hypothetical protein
MPQEPPITGTAWPCCGTFWVDVTEILKRPKADYVLIRDRLVEWSERVARVKKGPPREDLGKITHWPPLDPNHQHSWYYCARIGEYTWGLLLGQTKIAEDVPEFVDPEAK